MAAKDAKEFEVVSTSLDELTHAEMLVLYEEANRNVLYAKTAQWKTVAATLIGMGALIFLAKFVSGDPGFAKLLVWAVILLAMGTLFVISLFQFWQHNEQKKMRAISGQLSNLFRGVRHLKSDKEGNVHRYVLLIFLYGAVIFGAVISYISVKDVSRFL